MTSPAATEGIERLARASRPGEWRNTLVNVSERGIRTDAGYICFLPKPQHYDGQDERYAEEMAEYEATAAYIAAVSPDVVLGLIADRDLSVEQCLEQQKLLDEYKALHLAICAERDEALAALRAAEAERDEFRAAEPYAYLCTSLQFNTEIIYDHALVEERVTRPERWTVTPMYLGAALQSTSAKEGE